MIFRLEHRDGLAHVTIGRPPVNAVSPEFIAELRELVEQLRRDEGARAVLFVSDIPGKFMAGADLADILTGERPEQLAHRLRELSREWRQTFYALERLPQPTIAAIGGHCLGGGLEFALCCDFRLMVDDGQATIGQTETNLGLFPAAGGTLRLPRVVGVGIAKDMIFRARRLLAPEAKAIGLVTETWGPDDFDREALAFAQAIARGPTQAVRAAKSAILGGLADPALGDRLEEDGFVRVVQTEDAVEGISAFWQKRPPHFKGR